MIERPEEVGQESAMTATQVIRIRLSPAAAEARAFFYGFHDELDAEARADGGLSERLDGKAEH
jgi:hypothetical protein